MNFVLYILIGAILGELILGKSLGYRAMIIGAIIACIPEIDTLFSLFMTPIHALKYANGVTHSIFLLIFLPPALAIIINRIYSNEKLPMHLLTILSFWALVSNILIDLFSIHGVAILFPFNNKRFAISSISSNDYFFIFPLLIGVVVLILLKQKTILKKIICWFFVLFISAYLSFSIINKVYITSVFEQALFNKNMTYTHTEAFPMDNSNFNWYLIARHSDGFWESETSNFSKDSLQITFEKRNEFFLIDYEDTEAVKYLKKYTRMWYNVSPGKNGGIYYFDLRYGKKNGVYKHYYKLTYDSKNILQVNMYN